MSKKKKTNWKKIDDNRNTCKMLGMGGQERNRVSCVTGVSLIGYCLSFEALVY